MKSKKQPLESAITKEILTTINRQPGAWFFKSHGGAYQVAGVPDIIGHVDGVFVGLEVKRPGVGRLTKLQAVTIRRIEQAGGVARVVCSAQEAMEVLEQARRRAHA